MRELIEQERFELEVLDRLNSRRLLNNLVFAGGTMLRLCYGLDRYSVDLDFRVTKDIDFKKLFLELKKCFAEFYKMADSANKYHTILFELKSPAFRRGLKIEIRKEPKKIKTGQAIAYSQYADTQVMLNAVSLPEMMQAKLKAFLNRKEIRDVFDIEFLLKKGFPIEADRDTLALLLKGIEALTKKDYSVKLGSILEQEKRKYYTEKNFTILKLHVKEKLAR